MPNLSRTNRLFKKLTPENWQQRDTTSDPFVRVRDGVSESISSDDWAAAILECKLAPSVPNDVRNLFEVAQGVLCYGCFFYPLYTLGAEQLYRVMEAALSHKCDALDVPKLAKTFQKKLDWLRDKNILCDDRLSQWEAARSLRNMASHATRQSIYDPIAALQGLRNSEELINELFEL